MVKTTIEIEDELWKRFSVAVILEHGSRKKAEVIKELIREYTNSKDMREKINKKMKEREVRVQ